VTFRITEIEVPKDDPFRNDALERRPVVEFLSGLIARTAGPFVLALDSPWGSGKTTLVRMLKSELERHDFQCIHFNAWRVDHAVDPLVALVSSVDRVQLAAGAGQAKFDQHVKTIRKVTSLVAKRGAVAIAKALTVGALDFDKEIEDAAAELTGGTVEDIVSAFKKEGELLDKFRAELESAVALLPESGKKSTLVWFVDELDRCRPTFAVELLERVKHLFDAPNVLFVLALDKRQLSASLSAVYGQGFDAEEYLRRFIDLEFKLPLAKNKRFIEMLFASAALDSVLAKRTHPELRQDRQSLIDLLTMLADAIPLSLRQIERAVTRLQVVMDQTPSDHYLHPVLVALLVVLRSHQPDLFFRMSDGRAGPDEVVEFLGGLPGGERIVNGRAGIFIHAHLLAAESDEDRKAALISALKAQAADEAASQQARKRASEVLGLLGHVGGAFRGDPRLSVVAAKIDLARNLRD
jgi:hypothetical protein